METVGKHQKVLKNIPVVSQELPQYQVSNLTKAYLAIYEERYDEVLAILDAGIEMGSDAIIHMDHDEKSAEDYVREYITRKEYLEIENPVKKVIEVREQKKGFLSSLFKKRG